MLATALRDLAARLWALMIAGTESGAIWFECGSTPNDNRSIKSGGMHGKGFKAQDAKPEWG
jgi:hypothetical protein